MIVISSLFFLYILTILIFTIKFDRVADFVHQNKTPKTSFTIVVPFRNEAKNLPIILSSIENLNYPKELFQFIFVDDDSRDDSLSIIERFFANTQNNIRVLKNTRTSNSPKKDAITSALKSANTEWIITTDADCILPKNWLKTIDNYLQQYQCNMIVAPVSYTANSSSLHQFQLLDFLSLQASTISGFGLQKPFLCNGANLIYKKDVFEKVDGFVNNNSIASGDDVFLFEKFLQHDKQKVHYLKSEEVIITTSPVNSFKELIHQRVRWASKTANYNLAFGKLIGVQIVIGNGIISASPLFILSNYMSIKTFISMFLIKLFFDYLLINKVAVFQKQKIRFSTYFLSGLIYPYFTILIFLKSITNKYEWKDRTFTK
jgi:cellulose synthase/poly-beta-1,6-N-acetylglucosamine synthase-like glycosyltransferase